MPGFIGSKAKTKEKTITQQWYTEEHDIDTVTGGAEKSLTVGAGATVETVDEEIVEKALDFARFAYEQSGQSYAQMVGASEAVSKDAAAQIGLAYQTATGKVGPLDINRAVLVVGIVAAIAIAAKLTGRI